MADKKTEDLINSPDIDVNKLEVVETTTSPTPDPVVDKTTTTELVKPSEPEKKDDTIDFSSFLKVVKPEEGEVVPTIKPTTEPVKPTVTKVERDVSDLDPELAPLFKQNMSNDAFNKLKPLVLEHRKLKAEIEEREKKIKELEQGSQRIPESYYEHPHAFALTPEFAQHSAKVNVLGQIQNHWRKQLKAIRDGATEYEYLKLDDNGKYVIEKREATADAETDLMIYMNHVQNELSRANSELESFSSGFKKQHSDALNWVKGFESSAFSLFDKEEGKNLLPIVEDTVAKLPAQFRSSPLARILAKSLVTNQQMATLLKQIANQQQTAPVVEDKRKAGPTSDETQVGASNGNGDVTVDDFERIKLGL